MSNLRVDFRDQHITTGISEDDLEKRRLEEEKVAFDADVEMRASAAAQAVRDKVLADAAEEILAAAQAVRDEAYNPPKSKGKKKAEKDDGKQKPYEGDE